MLIPHQFFQNRSMYFIIIQPSSHRTHVHYKPKDDADIALPTTRT
jgi:hypothetical protein